MKILLFLLPKHSPPHRPARTDTDKVYRLIVSVSLLQRSVAVEIDREWARPIADGMGPRAVPLSERTRPLARAG